MNIILKNDTASCVIDYHGAELKSFKKGDREYMWQADPAFWGRTSPVLFPFVGGLKNKEFVYQGTAYPMGQHGFARDMDFSLVSATQTECFFELLSNEETLKKYPFDFKLVLGYRLEGDSLSVIWSVTNTGSKELFFSIGAHPAFNATLDGSYFALYKDGKPVDEFVNSIFGAGLLTDDKETINLSQGKMKLSPESFDGDAFVIEDSQVDEVRLLDKMGQPFVGAKFTAPLVGIWSPPKKNAPFICIEPWYGRADKESFQGNLEDREWGNSLKPGEEFLVDYKITLF